jgi:uncharacterized protein (DUF433 family)
MSDAIVSNPGIFAGRPVFQGTRVPIDIVFDHLKAGYSLQDCSEMWPGLDPADLKAAMDMAVELLEDQARKKVAA